MSYFICSNCGYGSASWMGKCPDCGSWNTFAEKNIDGEKKKELLKKSEFTSLAKIKPLHKNKKPTGLFEFDRVLGYGLVPGEVILLTGEPGVGKSTLLLQSLQNLKTVYVSGEESAEQVKERADRLKIKLDNFLFSDNLQIEGMIASLEEIKNKIDVLVVDSIQTVYSKGVDAPSGAPSQLKETTMRLISFGKKNKITVIIIGHITKEGEIAGPKTLEHLVDCVISFEGEKVSNFRILRAAKNRFGSTEEIGIFEMGVNGLGQVKNSLAFVEETSDKVTGRAIVGVAEGRRPLFFEIQTLVSPTILSFPRRVVKGIDYNKLLLLLAVSRKHLNLSLDRFDIYVNVIGGVSITSTASDLGVIASLYSSIKNLNISQKTVFVGEVGLLGEVRKVFFEDKVVQEAKRLQFKKIISPSRIKNIKELPYFFK